MSAKAFKAHANHFLKTAKVHPEYRGGIVEEVGSDGARLIINVNVEMPFPMRARGVSPTGVRRVEDITVELWATYPWTSPQFALRPDFNRSLPHLLPGSRDEPPRPCLVDGSQREFFYNAGSLEAGIYKLLEQLVEWLRRAAKGALIDPAQGWEPIRRDTLDSFLAADAGKLRGLVSGSGGFTSLRMNYYRSGAPSTPLGDGPWIWGRIPGERRSLNLAANPTLFTADSKALDFQIGHSVAAVVWPDRAPDGGLFVSNEYFPETVGNLDELRARARDLGCGRPFNGFIDELERAAAGHVRGSLIPIAVILCARRPHHVIGTDSDIELVSYLIEGHFGDRGVSIFPNGGQSRAVPAGHRQTLSAELLRTVSGGPVLRPVTILGCGSVGSKIALHLARAGTQISAVADSGFMSPHNIARHALANDFGRKAEGVSELIEKIGSKPVVFTDDLLALLRSREHCELLFGKPAAGAINTTASLAVRESLTGLAVGDFSARLLEIGLFGRGRGGFLFAEGPRRNPNLSDLMAEFYANINDAKLRNLVFGEGHGFADVQIGQGCGSLTMPMTDARLSTITAAMAEEAMRIFAAPLETGELVVATGELDNPSTAWSRRRIRPFTVVPIEGANGWSFRLSGRVVEEMRTECASHPNVETGGLLLGTCSPRTQTVTVVDLLPAPADSKRSAHEFVLGTKGLAAAIRWRFEESGQTMFDVGTWHSHLSDQGPSYRDRRTAAELAAERPPPSALLIVCRNATMGSCAGRQGWPKMSGNKSLKAQNAWLVNGAVLAHMAAFALVISAPLELNFHDLESWLVRLRTMLAPGAISLVLLFSYRLFYVD